MFGGGSINLILRYRLFVGAVVLVTVLTAFFLQHRYRYSLNFLPVHVQLVGIPLTDVTVHYKSQFGSWGEIPVDPRYEGRWMQSPSINGVVQLAIAGPTSINWGDLRAEVRCGESWNVSVVRPQSITSDVPEIPLNIGPHGRQVHFAASNSSVFRNARGTINWQGDLLLFAVPVLQALGFFVFIVLILKVTRGRGHLTNHSNAALVPPKARLLSGASSVVTNVLWVYGIIYLGQHVLQSISSLADVRFGTQLCAALAYVSLIVAGGLFWIRRVAKSPSESNVVRDALVLMVIICLLKAMWCVAVDSVQPSDLARYFKYGHEIAAGNWSYVNSDQHPFREIFAQRAYFFTAPIFRVFGTSTAVLECANIVMQMCTLLLFFLWAKAVAGVKPAAIGIYLLAIYPDWWYAVTLASHDTPAMLLFSLILYSFSRSLDREDVFVTEHSARGRLSAYIWGAIAGFLISYLSLQRGIAPVVWIGLIVWFVFQCMLQSRDGFKTMLLWIRNRTKMLCAVLVVYVLSQHMLPIHLNNHLQRRPGESTLATLSSVGSDKDARVRDTHPWRLLYLPSAPIAERDSLIARKLLWEKVGAGNELWFHALRVNQLTANCERMMEFAFCGMEREWFQAWDLYHWSEKRVLCSCVYGFLALFAWLRILLRHKHPVRLGEVFSLGMALAFAVLLPFALESAGTYDMYLMIPLALSGGILTAPAKPVTPIVPCSEQSVRSVSLGVVILALILMLHQVAAAQIMRRFPPFTQFDKSNVVGDTVSHSHPLKVRLPLDSFCKSTEAAFAECHFTLASTKLAEKKRLRGFLSADQEEQGIFWIINWEDCPVQYELSIGGTIVSSGLLRELSQPLFFDIEVAEPAADKINGRLRAWTTTRFADPPNLVAPALCVEYLH